MATGTPIYRARSLADRPVGFLVLVTSSADLDVNPAATDFAESILLLIVNVIATTEY